MWIVAPTYDLAQKVFRELQKMLQQHFKELLVKERWSDMHCVITNLGGGQTEIRGKSADKPDGLIGEGVDFLIVDEAARIKADVWEEHLSPTLIDKKGRALLISTPKGFNFFHSLYKRGQPGPDHDPDWQSWQFPSTVNPILPADDIEKERLRLPDSSYRQEYLAEFADGAGQVFSNVRERAILGWPSLQGMQPAKGDGYKSPERYSAGLDLAQVHDWTVLTILDSQRRVVRLDRFNKMGWDQQIPRICNTLSLYNNAECLVDATGVGSSIFERLRDKGANVRPVKFTNERKADIVNNLAALLEHGEITLPEPKYAKELIDELEAFAYSTTDSGTVRMAAPGAGHDDCVISLALAAWGNRPASICRAQITGRSLNDPEQVLTDHIVRSGSMPGMQRRSLFNRCTRD